MKPANMLGAVACALALALTVTASTHAQDYKAVLAGPDRTEADVKNDAKRDAHKLLEFTGVKTGWTVLDMGAGGGYSTELMARAVGPSGKVYGQNAKESERFAARKKTPAFANVVSLERPFDDPVPADVKNLDLITFFFVYHDTTFMAVDRAKMNRAMFAALKPGAHLIIADHSAKAGDGAAVGKTLHRIEEKTLVEEVTKAGFKLAGSADFLRNPADPRTERVQVSGIRNDEFVLRFQKPN